MKLAVLRETAAGERRVALVPESVKKLTAAGFSICVEAGAGENAFYGDNLYKEAGATIESSAAKVVEGAGMVLKVGIPTSDAARNEIELFQPGQMLLSSLMPTRHPRVMQALADRGVTSFSTDAIPRTTRAQAMDTLSSMANIVGYKGVLLAAAELSKYFPMFMTAAGTVFAAKIFVIGAGVAGLQAIATAKRLGGNMFATDVRPEVKEQIESVGAKYVGIDLGQTAQAGGGYAKELSEENKAKQREMLVEQCAQVDVVISTALIGGVFAPKIITADMVRKMKPGSVIMDLAADGGGNCELSQPGRTVVENGVTICAPLNLPATMPTHASLLWSRNLLNFLMAFWKDKKFQFDLKDDILAGALITHEKQITHAKTKEAAARA
ncbi:MAG: Re/Si-specific NAD(P)(+) transhydrogenase subunit alpha [Phycisphaerales bacterium]